MHGAIARMSRQALVAGRMAVLGVVLTAGSFGCGGSRAEGDPMISQGDARLNIEIRNNNLQNITVHVISLGRRQRLGMVFGTQTETYFLPWDRGREIQIELDMLAAGECFTRQIWADPGDHIFMEIESHIDPLDCVPNAFN